MPSSVPAALTAPPAAARPVLARDRDCLVAGVCAGLARHLSAPVWMLRALFVALSLCGGAGLLLYAWCWALTPVVAGEAAMTRRAPVAWLLLVLAAAAVLVASPALVGGTWQRVAEVHPAALVLLGGAVALAAGAGLWAALIDRADTARGPRHAAAVRIAAIAVLLVLFLLLVPSRPVSVGWLVMALLPLGGILVVGSSSLLRRWRELAGERVRRIREEQRSEMAAHLHDSVLQTLALIQNRAGASSEAARLARAQERELRAWLYDGDAPADSDLPTDLRDYAAALELDFPVRIDVVSAGLSAERASGELAAAAREAMLNAARHAGGDVSVYIESSPDAVDVFIRDRGEGFVLDEVPGDRLGVRESILGRMRRAGGTATVRSDADGTEVQLRSRTGDARG